MSYNKIRLQLVFSSFLLEHQFHQPTLPTMSEVQAPTDKKYISYNNVHKLCQEAAETLKEFKIDLMIAIGGGGFIPARILRTHIRVPGSKNIPIQAIGLSLYEELGTGQLEEQIGVEVVRTQWLDFSTLEKHSGQLIGKNILIVDEVDDTRTTLHYAVSELEKDVAAQAKKLGREDEKTNFHVFVLHNKDKPKKAQLPADMMESGRYVAARTTPDEWIAYPWEAKDIEEHTTFAKLQKND